MYIKREYMGNHIILYHAMWRVISLNIISQCPNGFLSYHSIFIALQARSHVTHSNTNQKQVSPTHIIYIYMCVVTMTPMRRMGIMCRKSCYFFDENFSFFGYACMWMHFRTHPHIRITNHVQMFDKSNSYIQRMI